MALLAIVVFCFIGVASALDPVPRLDGRIVGGTPAQITEAPYQVALLLDYWSVGNFDQYCGGALISKRAVLTAAHCTENTQVNQWHVRAGSTYHHNGGFVVYVSGIQQHPNFNQRLDNDIAVVFMVAELILGNDVRIATLPSQGQTVSDGSLALVSGWGTLTDGGVQPQHLYKVTVPVVNQQTCVNAYATFNPVTSNMICAGNMASGGVDICFGDSGGPMVVNGFLIGLVSWNRGCGQPGSPGVYTRVPSYRNWINSVCPSC